MIVLKKELNRHTSTKNQTKTTYFSDEGSQHTSLIDGNSVLNIPISENWLGPVSIQGQKGTRTNLPILFSSGSAVIPKGYEPFLRKIADLIKSQKYEQVIVDGFTDTNPIHTKKYPSNFELGAQRAANVVHALVKNGVSPSCFKISSTGEYRFPEQRPVSDVKQMDRYATITLLE